MKTLLIWGAGDQGTVTLDCALAMKAYSKIDFLELKEKGHRDIPGYQIYKETEIDLSKLVQSYDEVIVASGSNDIREAKIAVLTAMGVSIATVIHPTAVISPFAKISMGCAVFANTVIHTNAFIGIGCIVNTGTIIEHDCIVEDYVNICPRVSMAGHTKIGSKSFLGIGSTVINAIDIGKRTVVGAGAVVIRNVPNSATVVGVPAKVIR